MTLMAVDARCLTTHLIVGARYAIQTSVRYDSGIQDIFSLVGCDEHIMFSDDRLLGTTSYDSTTLHR